MGWARKGYPKAVKSLIFNAINHVCTCMDRIEQKYRQKCAHKSFKKCENGGGGGRQGQGDGMDQGGGIKPW
jgi:hypothetical protein